jgi:hypothetical protein
MKVVIVARTRMNEGKICIGGISEEAESFRLMDDDCNYHMKACPYEVGEIWDMKVKACKHLEAPHLEDVAVIEAKKLGIEKNLWRFIAERTTPWKGSIESIFDGKIRFTGNGSAYISHSGGLPSVSTGFWIPDTDLEFKDEPRVAYFPKRERRYLSYVGTGKPRPVIESGTLVRVSLAKWWKQKDTDSSLELRCYAQLSGWYDK